MYNMFVSTKSDTNILVKYNRQSQAYHVFKYCGNNTHIKNLTKTLLSVFLRTMPQRLISKDDFIKRMQDTERRLGIEDINTYSNDDCLFGCNGRCSLHVDETDTWRKCLVFADSVKK